MNPVIELRQALTQSSVSNGVVVGVNDQALRVQTEGGVITVEKGINTDVVVGDSVKVANSAIIGRQRREVNVPVFHL